MPGSEDSSTTGGTKIPIEGITVDDVGDDVIVEIDFVNEEVGIADFVVVRVTDVTAINGKDGVFAEDNVAANMEGVDDEAIDKCIFLTTKSF
ncbi:hypothetical protein NDU88_002578 [Pleurodeles waltl]|uniref:Uncharacterized protein n=1 Tax=Pleurodeles waltl TaxID=8319 RepID=A0AAV7P741_PLEWA|nr:hypothetical protein NDU88_002578 [Pleurodeles waltl]